VKSLASFPDSVFLGTSGWSYNEWIGPFYTKMDKSKLRAYAKVFGTVEIDSTFYRYPSKGMVMGWTRYSPEGFIYTAKLPGLITHDKKLNLGEGIEQDLERFIDLMEPLVLSGKLGCILIQLPPKYHFRPDNLEAFFKILPTHVKFAVEFRDPSWMRSETWSLLEKYRVAYTIVDEPLLPPETHLTSDIAYFRWHGCGEKPWYDYRYSVQELEPWIPKLKDAAKKVEKIYGYFNNHYHGYAVENCLQVIEMIGSINAKQVEAKTRVENHLKASGELRASTLESFIEPKDVTFESLMHYFVPSERLRRAEQIEESELAIKKQDSNRVEATIRDYHVIIDAEATTISHDCPDWERVLATKKLCKHVAKLLLSMNRENATELLRKMYTQEQKWRFVPCASQ
jgi:uncharacterized protein YecE (DUF72 family)